MLRGGVKAQGGRGGSGGGKRLGGQGDAVTPAERVPASREPTDARVLDGDARCVGRARFAAIGHRSRNVAQAYSRRWCGLACPRSVSGLEPLDAVCPLSLTFVSILQCESHTWLGRHLGGVSVSGSRGNKNRSSQTNLSISRWVTTNEWQGGDCGARKASFDDEESLKPRTAVEGSACMQACATFDASSIEIQPPIPGN